MNLLRRALALVLALAPLAAQADACTLGAVTGRTDVQCGMEMALATTPAVAAESGSCPFCHAGAPARGPSRGAPAGAPTCCDLKPQATPAAFAPQPAAPAGFEHPAIAAVVPAPEARPAAASLRFDPDVGRAPPHAGRPPLPSRAPPLG